MLQSISPVENDPLSTGLFRDLVTIKDCVQSISRSLEDLAFSDEIPDLSHVYSEICSITLMSGLQGQKLDELLQWLEKVEFEGLPPKAGAIRVQKRTDSDADQS